MLPPFHSMIYSLDGERGGGDGIGAHCEGGLDFIF